jgi:ADP-heptose:LPS heptosyltransferase
VKRVLLVRLSAMGDVVQCLGATRALAAAQPDLELHFVVQERFLPLLDGQDYLASRIVFDRFGGLAAVWRLRSELRRLRPDVALDLQGNWKSALVAWLSGAPVRVGAHRRQRREPRSGWLLNRHVSWAGPPHPARMATEVVRELWPAVAAATPRLVPAADAMDAAAADLRAAGIDPDQPFTVFVVTAPADPRSWRLAAMQRQLELQTEPTLFLLGPDTTPAGLPATAKRIVHGKEHVAQLVALGHLVAAAGGRVMGPDKGPTHVLCAAGARTQVLFGPGEPARTAPPGAEPLQRRQGPACMPCQRPTCNHSNGPVCMDFTTSEAGVGTSV